MSDFLEKLKSIDLQNIDLSKIDVNKIVEMLLSKKDLFAASVIGVVAFVSMIVLTKDFFTQTAGLDSEISLIRNKIEVISSLNVSKKKLKNFLRAVPPPIEEDLLSSTITDIAASNNVSVVSFVPGENIDEDLYSSTTGGFDVEAPDYASLLLFLSALEKSPHALRIDNCVIIKTSNDDNMQMGVTTGAPAKDKDVIKVHLDLTSIEIKK